MDKRKIAFFQPHIGPGGLTRVMLQLAQGVAQKGYQVDLVITNNEIIESLKGLVPDNVNIVTLSSKRIITSILPLTKYLKREKPDVLISAGPSTNCVAELSKILSKHKCETILTEHNLPSVDVSDRGGKKAGFITYLMRKLYPKADHLVAVSTSVAEDLAAFISCPRESIKVIYNPVVTPSLIDKSKEEIEHSWLDSKHFVILYVGRLEPVKNLPLLIEAFSLARQDTELKLIVVGDGSEKKGLIKLTEKLKIEKDVDFVGYSSNPYAYMKNTNLLALTAKWEGLPTVIIESMACGTPTIVTDNIYGAKEILEDGKYGIIAKNEIKDVARILSSAPEMVKSYNNVEERASFFTIENSVIKYMQLFKDN